MSHAFDTFLLYYASWHEGEFGLFEMKAQMLADLGRDGYNNAVAAFSEKLRELDEEQKGVKKKRTMYQIMKERGEI